LFTPEAAPCVALSCGAALRGVAQRRTATQRNASGVNKFFSVRGKLIAVRVTVLVPLLLDSRA